MSRDVVCPAMHTLHAEANTLSTAISALGTQLLIGCLESQTNSLHVHSLKNLARPPCLQTLRADVHASICNPAAPRTISWK